MGQKFGALACALVLIVATVPWMSAEEPEASDPFGPGGPAAAAGRGAPPDQTPAVAADEARKRRWSLATGDPDEIDAQARIESVLRGPLKASFDFSETPLNAITAQIEQEYDIPIVFDVTALDAIAASPETEVSVRIANVTLRTALDWMLRGVEDLTYIVDNEVLLITTQDEANQRLETRVYRVDDLIAEPALRDPSDPGGVNSLIDLIVTNVERDSWTENGTGEGEITPYLPGMLVVTQTARVQGQIEALLATLRAVKESIKSDPATSAAAESPKSITRGFPLSDESLAATDESRDALQKAIEATVAWDASGDGGADKVFLHVFPKRVLVRHSPRVVGQVAQALRDINVTTNSAVNAGGSGRGSSGSPGAGGGMF